VTAEGTTLAGVSALAGVVVPAHDESALIGMVLDALTSTVPPGTFDVVVVCNGCSDDTAEIARRVPGVRVVELARPSKSHALSVGAALLPRGPRVQLDADVMIDGRDVLALVTSLGDGIEAVAPERRLPLAHSSWPVRAYYRVWTRLPQVRDGLFGRGVIVLSVAGQARVDALPPVLSDDLAISECFAPGERRVVGRATATVRPPRRLADLVRRRARVVAGNRQADALRLRGRSASTGLGTLVRLALADPRTALAMPVFAGVTIAARRLGTTEDGWLRDESSRAA